MAGAFNYSPEKFGGSEDHDAEVILRSLLEADGTALSKEVDSYVWAERNAEARVLAYLWSLNRRFSNQWDPARMTDFLPRWERILGIRPLASDTLVSRRAKVQAKLEAYGQEPTQQVVEDLLRVFLGDVFVTIINTPSTSATGYVTGGATVPGGVTLPDGTPLGISWYSSIAHLAIKTRQPAAIDDPTFYDSVGQIPMLLDELLPAWVTFDWFLDGGTGAGFILDEDKNLDHQRFD